MIPKSPSPVLTPKVQLTSKKGVLIEKLCNKILPEAIIRWGCLRRISQSMTIWDRPCSTFGVRSTWSGTSTYGLIWILDPKYSSPHSVSAPSLDIRELFPAPPFPQGDNDNLASILFNTFLGLTIPVTNILHGSNVHS